MSSKSKTKLTPPQLAERWGISADKIVHWIKAGELRAIDASLKRGDRPRYLIDVADVEAFEAARAVVPEAPPARRQRETRPEGFVRYFG